MAFCSNCGKELKDEWKFCEGCGTEIKVNKKTNKKEDNKFNVSSSKKGSKSLKIIIGILICALVFGIFAIILGAIAPDDRAENNIENIVEEEVIKYYDAKFSIKFIGNLIFNKYNVIFCVDDGEENTLEHGVNKDIEMTLEEGTHYLYFTNAEDSTIETKVEIDIQANTDYGFEIICYYDEISVETLYEDADIKLDETQIKMSVDKTEYVGKDYKEVVKKLSDLGFINIIEKPVYDIYWGITPEGEVESVTIDGVDTYKRGSVLNNTSEVIVTYHMKEENDPNKKVEETNTVKIEEPKEETKKEENIVETKNTIVETPITENKVEEVKEENSVFPEENTKLGKDFDSKSDDTIYYINTDGIKNVPKIKQWENVTVTDGVYEYFEELEKEGYTIKIIKNDKKRPYSGFWYYDSEYEVSKGDKKYFMFLGVQDEKYTEYEFRIEY